MEDLTVIVLAAGGGTRMRSATAKVLHEVAGRSMIGHVLSTVASLSPARVVTVVGHQREQVSAEARACLPSVDIAVQEKLDGTGGAVRAALAAHPVPADGLVVVLTADAPLLRAATLREFVDRHRASQHAVSVLTGVVDDPTGYGRILRTSSGSVAAIVEHKDATPEQREITEINSGILAFDAGFLTEAVDRLGVDNVQGEYYLTDTLGLAEADELAIGAHVVADVAEIAAANDRAQLAELGRLLNERITHDWMLAGVTIVDPHTTWIGVDVHLDRDTTLLPGTQLSGVTHIGEGATVGPDTTLTDCTVEEGATVVRSHGVGSRIRRDAVVGPFSYLRPGTDLGADGKIGAFVETKNAVLGTGAKVPHLSYVGDAEIGEGTNIGAGTIVANYDGQAKHRTTVGRHARTGSNNTFVAPVTIGDGAATGGGSVIRDDVPPGALAVSAGPQRTIEGWAARRRPGTDQAAAAESADDAESTPSD